MDLTPYVARLREDLSTAASAGDEHMQRAAAALSATLEPAVRLTLMTALSDLAAEITAQLPEHVVEVRLDGRDLGVVVTETARESPADPGDTPPRSTPPPADSGDISRMTLRLFEQLKSQAEQAAAAQGVSLNTFVSQAVQGALRGKQSHDRSGPGGHGRRGGSHLRGWVGE